ncbi:MAG TPA: ABC transporter ATP-binding protein, partial [Burkholderiaceae bacterium]|nr:ABC transporter ATP-binding protein [Burkholderiaceae bacterium]
TTLLMSIAGFVEPSSGRIELDGKDITNLGPEGRNFGVVFQGYALFPHMSVWDNVWFPLRARNLSRKQAADVVEETLDMLELLPYARRMPAALSGGQQQRVALARALVFKPELLLLDEPLSALDKALRKSLQSELKALHNRVGTTFIYVTHDQEEALSMSDRIAILRDGRIQQIGSPQDLYHHPRSRFVADFLGRTNFIDGRLEAVTDSQARIATSFGEVEGSLRSDLAAGSPATLAIRPERISITLDEPQSACRVQGNITEATFLGDHFDLSVAVGDTPLSVILGKESLDSADQFQPGVQVWLGWETESALVLAPEATS